MESNELGAEHARAIFGAFDRQDIDALSALMTDDVRLQIGNTDVVTGKAAFEQSLIAFFDSVAGFRHKIVEVWSDGDALITELEVRYTRLDGSSIALPCCNVFRLRDSLVADYRVYMDINPVYE